MLAATSAAALVACSSDDGGGDEQSEALPLEAVDPTEVPARAAGGPAAPPAADPLPSGSDTLNGLALPDDMADWRIIGVVNVQDPATGNPVTVRVIVGNDIAVDAARAGQTNPWPENAMMGHLQWQATPSTSPGSTAVVAGDFAAATLMVKNTGEYGEDGGWAYGVWTTPELRPLNNPTFDQACVDCHTSRVQAQDYVFTIPGALPDQAAVDAAPVLPNGIELPSDILDWRVISVASREGDANPNIRVVIGNDIAVEAARAGDTNPWPDGAILGHYVWAAGDNPVAPDTVNPVGFNAFTVMVKDSVEYAADGGWAYGNWATPALNAPDEGFDRACVDCHTSNVSDKDFVFTVPGDIPALLGG